MFSGFFYVFISVNPGDTIFLIRINFDIFTQKIKIILSIGTFYKKTITLGRDNYIISKHCLLYTSGYVPEDLLYQIVEINGEKVRVYGINIPEEKQEEHQVFVYADIEKYEEIAMSDTENRESVADTDILQGENHTDQEAYHYRIQVVNEAVAEKVIDTLSLPGISVQNTEALEKQQEQREKIMEKIWQWILGLAGSLLSGVVLIWQQGKLWMAEHQGFVLYMQQILSLIHI